MTQNMVRRAIALAIAACLAAVALGTPEYYGAGPSPECGPYDVIMLLDASGSIERFQKSQRIAKAIAAQFNIGTEETQDRVTALSFGSTIFKKKHLWQIKTPNAFNKLVNSMEAKEESETNIPYALDSATTMMNARPRDATEVFVLISDGNVNVNTFSNKFVKKVCSNIGNRPAFSQEAMEECFYLQAAEVVDDNDIQLIYVPVGDEPFIPSGADPIEPYLEMPTDLSTPNKIAQSVAELVCETTTPEGCQEGVDIIFVVDASYTIDMDEYNASHVFVLDFASRYAIDGDDGARFGLIEYSTVITQEFSILESDGSLRFPSQADFEAAVNGIDRDITLAENTNTPLALQTALAMIESTSALDAENGREDRPTFVIHVGDNDPNVEWSRGRIPKECANWNKRAKYPKQAAKVCSRKFAQEIQDTSATFVSVLVGGTAAGASLYNPVEPEVQLYEVDDYASLVMVVDEIVDDQCGSGPEEVTPAPTDETPRPTTSPTDSPTTSPTLGPVEVIPGCYKEEQIYRATAANRLETIEDDPGVQTPEQCQATCVENPECNYWSFRADSGNSDGNARAQCNLMAALRNTVSGSARWTSGPRICTQAPTTSPTDSPTGYPTDSPTGFPTDSPTGFPTDSPTGYPTDSPTGFPTDSPTGFPTDSPTGFPTDSPTGYPTDSPTGYPTDSPTGYPTDSPTGFPTDSPTGFPTDSPTGYPTDSPTGYPTDSPTGYPTDSPTGFPTDSPTGYPTDSPTGFPTDSPTSFPTDSPTGFPTDSPTGFPTDSPTGFPTDSPTGFPTDSPTGFPTDSPTGFPTDSPTGFPTDSPTGFPTDSPTGYPTDSPTGFPTDSPTGFPTDSPTGFPTDSPTGYPTDSPTGFPTDSPTGFPTDSPTGFPTDSPTGFPTDSPTGYPTDSPTGYPTDSPTGFPTDSPTGFPTFAPVDGCPDAELDIVWVVDNSGSIDQNGATGSKQLNDLLPRMIEGYTLTQSETRFAGFRFVGTIVETDGTVDGNNPFGSGPSGDPGSPFFFNEDASTNENGAWVSFGETNDGDGFTNTPQALQAAAHILSLDENEGGPRDDVVKVVVLLTDGNPNRYWGTECGDIPEITGPGGNENVRDPNDVACTEYQAAKLINDYGAYLVVVRIGNNLDSDFMEHCIVQSTPADPNQPPSIKQIESSFEVLQDTIDAIIEATCINTSYINPNPVWYPASAQTCANSV